MWVNVVQAKLTLTNADQQFSQLCLGLALASLAGALCDLLYAVTNLQFFTKCFCYSFLLAQV